QAEDGIRDGHVTGVQTCALPILRTFTIFVFVVRVRVVSHLRATTLPDPLHATHQQLSDLPDQTAKPARRGDGDPRAWRLCSTPDSPPMTSRRPLRPHAQARRESHL